ncbi:4'-phosphopantetheinyl transferase family protein [Glutamicibacter sp. TV12E]|uniref:4'-phosphopantetheinyl transferase family protein n=1 Tax=Glutamicibacter sp. TV12E TaxID=3446362 RepID=UPI004034F588
MRIFNELLPASVHVAETRSELDDGPRYRPEDLYVANAVESRQQEFRTVRICARQALAELGHGGHVLVPDEHRAPVWPRGVVGSMTHCEGLRAAAVACSDQWSGIGIDAEPHSALPPGTVDLLLLPAEQEAVDRLSTREPGIAWDRLIFSAKESVFKTWFPMARRWLDFLECEITVGQRPGAFTARILQDGTLHFGADLSAISGNWKADGAIGHGLLATAIAVRQMPGRT